MAILFGKAYSHCQKNHLLQVDLNQAEFHRIPFINKA